MLRTRVIPCLLLKNGQLVKTIRFQKPNYVGDPINIVRIFNTKEVDEVIFLDISRTPTATPPAFKLIQEIASECFMPIAYGGGIRTLEDVKKLFALGVEKVALNTIAFEDEYFISRVAERYGSQSIIASIDVKKNFFGHYKVYSHCGKKKHAYDPASFAVEMEKKGAGEILLTSVDRDGTMSGYDIDLIKLVTKVVNIPLIACGGAGEIKDFAKAVHVGEASAVAAGSMVVYQGRNRAVLTRFPKRAELISLLP
ncbi:MAG: imidazole glycerol phosphate synthase subunit HisF [Gammaproteobacteria bacterium]|nr:imidazole glycerol phosphate synthase subunit HisF [Gammaproteobacteria bacterium]